VLVQWSPADRIFVIPFDANVRNIFSGSGDAMEQQGLLNAVAGQHAGGGTNMYACAERALQQMAKTEDLGNYLPAIIIMTDGRSDDQSAAFMSDWNAMEPHVPIFGITFGDADKTQLANLAAATAARVFDGRSDLAAAFRTARGYN
jgi:Ca-activated chloride channel family protein